MEKFTAIFQSSFPTFQKCIMFESKRSALAQSSLNKNNFFSKYQTNVNHMRFFDKCFHLQIMPYKFEINFILPFSPLPIEEYTYEEYIFKTRQKNYILNFYAFHKRKNVLKDQFIWGNQAFVQITTIKEFI